VAAFVVVSVYLYYRPLASYVQTRGRLQVERMQVEALSRAKARLEQRLATFTTVDSTREEARLIGYVRPGERLFIVKGIPGWRHARRSLRGDG
jgi:hypothetical protein